MNTKQLSSRVNAKQTTNADFPVNPATPITYIYGPVTSTASQTVINLSFAVDQNNKNNFQLTIDGRDLSEGAANDYQFTQVINSYSAQVTMNYPITAGLNIKARYWGIAQNASSTVGLNSLQASVNNANAAALKNLFINGAFDVWQRGTSTTVANAATAYLADRWYVKNSLGTSGVITYSQVAGTLVGSRYGASVKISTAPTASQVNGCELYQTLEIADSIQVYNNFASMGVSVKALGNVTQVGIQFFYNTSESKVTTAIGTETTFTVNSSSFSTGQLIGQAIGTAMTTGGVIGARIRITGVSTGNLYDINNGFVVEQAYANIGSVVGGFSRAGRNYQDELAMCQRYCYVAASIAYAAATYGTNVGSFVIPFPSPMRISPNTISPSLADVNNFGSAVYSSMGVVDQYTAMFVFTCSLAASTYGTLKLTATMDAEI